MHSKVPLPDLDDPKLFSNQEEKWKHRNRMSLQRQYFYSLIVSFGCVCAGTVLAWTSSVLPHITAPINATNSETIQQFQVTQSEAGLIGSIVAIGAVFGALPAGYLAKRIGIKLVFLGIAIAFALGWLGTLHLALPSILLGRFIGGIATGAVCVCVPIYISEIADVHIRGILGSFFQVSFCFGILLVNVVGACMPWTQISYPMAALPVLYFIALLCIPPIRLESSQDEDEPPATTWMQLKQVNNSRALFVGLGLVTFQQLSGVNAVIFYTGGIFAAAGNSLPSSVSTIIVTGAQMVMAIGGAMLIERFTRRRFLLFSAAGMAAGLVLLAAYFLTRPALPGVVPIISLVLFFFSYCAGYGPLPWLMMGEIFSGQFKSIGCSIATTFNWLLVFAVTMVFPILCAQLGEGCTFALFGLFNLAAVVFTWRKVPETRGKSSEEIQAAFFN